MGRKITLPLFGSRNRLYPKASRGYFFCPDIVTKKLSPRSKIKKIGFGSR